MSWKRTLGLQKEPLGAYLDEPTPQNAVKVAQEYEPDDITRFAETMGALPLLVESYGGSTTDVLELEQELAEYNRELNDASLDHRGQQLQRAWYGAGDVAANTGYGVGSFVGNTATGTVDTLGDVGVHSVDAFYDVLETRKNRKEEMQAS